MISYFEDVEIGESLELGQHTFTREEVERFAEKFDPQPFHLSEDGAAKTFFKHQCASGWHTAAVFMKLFVAKLEELQRKATEEGLRPARLGPSPGFKDLKWIKPVYVGDTLLYSRIVTGKTESRSRPEWGLLHSDTLAHNQDGTLVFSFKATVFLERKPR
ncbi:MAG: MaoC family dehydratase [Roseibium sp.]|uniref:MaoC family dehydratase n=1 Tax=Roseibium sp. TaxID=1936156 RepID=UPI002627640D|nr:MaoC family dehydratase [Roseibium sp.]MCV0429556.1 MaoC family dehydratase [Roseibium sp.]